MATRLPDGSIQMRDGRIIYANSVIIGADLCEIVPLCVPPPAWPFISGGGGGGGGGSGTPGARGADGARGLQGFQGTDGAFGGPQGNQGNQGFAATGVQGFQGFGFQGAQGNQGLAGSGAQGNQGNQGIVGFQGLQGFQGGGAQGIQGPTTPVFVFTSPGPLTTTDNMLIPWLPGRGTSVSTLTALVKTAPTGSDITVDFRTGTIATGTLGPVIGTVTILAGTFDGTTVIAPVLIPTTEFLAMEITAVGSTVAGSDLTGTAS